MSAAKFDIVLIVADAYRKDNADSAAATDRLFQKLRPSYSFERCFSSAPWTLPACSSILSGVHASTHGYFFHDRSLGLPTIGHFLKGEFHRVAVVNNSNLRTFTGFDQDFDEYHYVTGHQEPFEKARAVMAASCDKPRFLLFHSNIAHYYYMSSSRPYYEAHARQQAPWFDVGARVTDWAGLSSQERAAVRSIYDASAVNMENRLEDLVSSFDLDRTIVCFVADHGEGFDYALGRVHHGGRLHDDLIRVPLVFRLPKSVDRESHERLAAATRLSCSSSDVAPTLLELVGRKAPSTCDGHSLLRHSTDRVLPSEDRRYLYTASRERLNVNLAGKNTTWKTRLKNLVIQRALLRSFNVKSYVKYPSKLIVTSLVLGSKSLPRFALSPLLDRLFLAKELRIRSGHLALTLELYDLENDPAETANLLRGLTPADAFLAIERRVGALKGLDVLARGERVTLEAIARDLA